MPVKPFVYQAPFPMSPDKTEYYHLTSDYVKVEKWGDREMLVVDPEALRVLARQATHDNSFMLRREHNQMVAKILTDPEASENDKFVALTMLRNAEIAAKGQLPFCQDTGTAICIGKKGQNVYTGGGDEEQISHGVYDTYTGCNLRYSQNAPLNMYDEVNTGCNLPAQIDLYAVDGNEYNFLFVAKGGGSANKTYLYQGDKSAAQSPEARAIPRREDEVARHSRMSPLPYRVRHRRHIGRNESCHRKEGIGKILRQPPHYRQRIRPRFPRRGTRKDSARRSPQNRPRRSVRRQIFRP